MSGISAGHGLSFPLQHNLGDDTAYSMMHVPAQPVTQPSPPPPPPPQPQPHLYAAPPGSSAAGWYPNGMPPPASITPTLAPIYFAATNPPPMQPAALPHAPAVTEDRLREIMEAIVTRYFGGVSRVAVSEQVATGATAKVSSGSVSVSVPWLVVAVVVLGLVVLALGCAILYFALNQRKRAAAAKGGPTALRRADVRAVARAVMAARGKRAGGVQQAEMQSQVADVPDLWIRQVAKEVRGLEEQVSAE